MLGFGVLWTRTVAEQKSFMKLFVDEVFVDRLRALGTSDRVAAKIVAQILDADHIGNYTLGDAKLFLGPDAPGESNGAGSHRHVDIIRIDRHLLFEGVADERA